MKFLITIFLSSFLLFQIQPILAKMALPFFGGGASIWTACMLFFQLFLLFGYLYSHCLTKLTNLNHQIIIHSTLIGISLFLLPITPFTGGTSLDWQAPQLKIISSLFFGIGFPYFLLSATAPLIQKWYSCIPTNTTPYRLYSLSNLASLLALLSYPLLIEPNMTNQIQSYGWSIGYVIFALFILSTGYHLFGVQLKYSQPQKNSESTTEEQKGLSSKVLWLLFSAVSVTLMVSTTNAMTQNIPPTPFLWILPLCIYLLSYIICFNNDRWYVRKYWFILFACCSLATVFMFFIGTQFGIATQVAIYSLILLVACMVCHGELARLKPNKSQLTLFYLIMAIGGVFGSIFTSIIAEYIFIQYYEFPLALALVYLLFSSTIFKENNDKILSKQKVRQNNFLSATSMIALLAFSLYFINLNNIYSQDNVHNSRNFYGTLAVKDFKNNKQPSRMLFDGATSHGTQFLSPQNRDIPTSYYRLGTGVSLALQQYDALGSKNVGIIGLGTGTLASYGKPGDNFTFYELNPDVKTAANDYFSYLSNSKAKISVKLGDARVTLQNELTKNGSQQFQILVVDAFSSDSIPVHLLTLEAFQLYWKHLTDDGSLVLHISNNHLDLLPLVATLAENIGKNMFHFYSASDENNEHTAEWIIVTNNNDIIEDEAIKSRATYFKLTEEQRILWTDEYSNLLSVIKF